jgi:hypothetical protein
MSGEIDDRRAGPLREAVNLLIAGRVPATPITVQLLDLSRNGCKIQSAKCDRISQGATILLTISNLTEVAGQVVWQRGNSFGVQFSQDISEELIQQVLGDSAQRDSSGPDVFDSFGRILPNLVPLKR